MGIYSLENYEMYPTKIIRPQISREQFSNKGFDIYVHLQCNWADIEKERGMPDFEELYKQIINHENILIEIVGETPYWARENIEMYLAGFIRITVSAISKNNRVLGILVNNVSNAKEINEAYIEALDKIPLILDIFDVDLIVYFQKKNIQFGLLLQVDAENFMNSSENLARYSLTEIWKKSPVFINNQNENNSFLIEEAKRWHGTYSVYPIDLGYRFEVRKLAYPEAVSSKDVLPIRIWLANSGVSPCYESIRIIIKLSNGEIDFVNTLRYNPKLNSLGDIIHNEIIQLPELEKGNYVLSIGLFTDEYESLNLNLSEDIENGFYKMGIIEIDEEGEHSYSTIWNHYYPEGYYPLEDPKAPED